MTSKSHGLTGSRTSLGGAAGLSDTFGEESLSNWSLGVVLLLLLPDADRLPLDLMLMLMLMLALGGLIFLIPSGDSAFAQLVFRA